MKHIMSTPAPPSTIAPGLPRSFDAPVLWMLEKDRERRPPDLATAIRALKTALETKEAIAAFTSDTSIRDRPTVDAPAQTAATLESVPIVVAFPRPRSRAPLVIAALVVALAGGASLTALWRSSEPQAIAEPVKTPAQPRIAAEVETPVQPAPLPAPEKAVAPPVEQEQPQHVAAERPLPLRARKAHAVKPLKGSLEAPLPRAASVESERGEVLPDMPVRF
jgi:hypothetical protein